MKVSVIIPVYNGEADLPQLLKCLRLQTYPPEQVEYILVDNKSTDGTLHILQSAIPEFKRCGLDLQVAIEANIQSSYAARNTGIRLSKGHILAFTDADCRPEPQWLTRLIEPFKDAAIDLVVGEIAGLPSRNWLETYAEYNQVLSQKHTLDHPFCPYGQTANLAVKRSLFLEIGLFRPYLTTGGDADFCWRALKNSQRQYGFAPQARVLHRHRSTLKELRQQWQRYGRSNRYLHDLHGVDLMAKPQKSYELYLWTRWILREIPALILSDLQARFKADFEAKPGGRLRLAHLLSTPISIYCNQLRFQGQAQAKLPPSAHQIDRLEESPPEKSNIL